MRCRLPLVLVSAVFLAACSKPEVPPEPVRAVKTLTVSSRAADVAHVYAAEVRARTESRLGFRVGGKIIRRPVNLGEVVNAGQVLAQLDPQDLRLGQDAARGALLAAQANQVQAAADFRRYKELRDQGFISSAELERRETTLKSAQAQLDQAQAQVGVQGNQAAYATLVADSKGVITGVDAEPGMVVAAGASVVRLAQDGPRDVVFAVPEDHVGLFKPRDGQPPQVMVQLWGGGDSPALPAQVREVSAAADPVTRTFQVKADLGAAASNQVRLGQTATVRLPLPSSSALVHLPLSALKEEKGISQVWLVDPASMTVRLQPVQLAGADGNEALIAGGLAPGQQVVVAGVHVLSPGQKVKFYVDPSQRGGMGSQGTAVSVKPGAPAASTAPAGPAASAGKP